MAPGDYQDYSSTPCILAMGIAREMNSHTQRGVAGIELEDVKTAQKKALKFLSAAVSALYEVERRFMNRDGL